MYADDLNGIINNIKNVTEALAHSCQALTTLLDQQISLPTALPEIPRAVKSEPVDDVVKTEETKPAEKAEETKPAEKKSRSRKKRAPKMTFEEIKKRMVEMISEDSSKKDKIVGFFNETWGVKVMTESLATAENIKILSTFLDDLGSDQKEESTSSGLFE